MAKSAEAIVKTVELEMRFKESRAIDEGGVDVLMLTVGDDDDD